MEEYDISDFFDPHFSYRVTNMLQQYWQDSRYDYRRSPRPDNGLLLVTQGSISFRTESAQLQASAGDLILLPKGCHYLAAMACAQDYLINFDTDAKIPFPGPVRLLNAAPSQYVDGFRNLVELKLQGRDNTFLANGQFYLLLERIVSDWRSATLSRKSCILETALPLLTDDELTVARVAERCGISESGFRTLFRKGMGLSPLQYRMNCKIAKARFLLESSELSVQQITEALHFYDEAYFCKLFRQKVGCTPREYAKSQKL